MFWCVWRERRTRWLRCLHLQSKSKEIRSTTAARTLLVTSQPAISSSGKQQTGSSTFGGCCSISHSFISNAFVTIRHTTLAIYCPKYGGELGFLSLFSSALQYTQCSKIPKKCDLGEFVLLVPRVKINIFKQIMKPLLHTFIIALFLSFLHHFA